MLLNVSIQTQIRQFLAEYSLISVCAVSKPFSLQSYVSIFGVNFIRIFVFISSLGVLSIYFFLFTFSGYAFFYDSPLSILDEIMHGETKVFLPMHRILSILR